jgi:hypothetical protein
MRKRVKMKEVIRLRRRLSMIFSKGWARRGVCLLRLGKGSWVVGVGYVK